MLFLYRYITEKLFSYEMTISETSFECVKSGSTIFGVFLCEEKLFYWFCCLCVVELLFNYHLVDVVFAWFASHLALNLVVQVDSSVEMLTLLSPTCVPFTMALHVFMLSVLTLICLSTRAIYFTYD